MVATARASVWLGGPLVWFVVAGCGVASGEVDPEGVPDELLPARGLEEAAASAFGSMPGSLLPRVSDKTTVGGKPEVARSRPFVATPRLAGAAGATHLATSAGSCATPGTWNLHVLEAATDLGSRVRVHPGTGGSLYVFQERFRSLAFYHYRPGDFTDFTEYLQGVLIHPYTVSTHVDAEGRRHVLFGEALDGYNKIHVKYLSDPPREVETVMDLGDGTSFWGTGIAAAPGRPVRVIFAGVPLCATQWPPTCPGYFVGFQARRVRPGAWEVWASPYETSYDRVELGVDFSGHLVGFGTAWWGLRWFREDGPWLDPVILGVDRSRRMWEFYSVGHFGFSTHPHFTEVAFVGFDNLTQTGGWYRYRVPAWGEPVRVECGPSSEGIRCFPEAAPPLEQLPVPPKDWTSGGWADTQVYVAQGEGKGRLVQVSEDGIEVWKEGGVARTWDREVLDPGAACGAGFVPDVGNVAAAVTDDHRMHVVASLWCRPADEAAHGFDVLVDFFEACPE